MDWSIAEPAVVRVAGVNYRYLREGMSVPVLDHLSFEVRHGEILGVFGPNGCGKSSLLNVVAGLRTPRRDAEVAVKELLAFFGDPLDLRRYPYRLSGGQQQLLALLRCLIQEPHVALFDEPFSAISFHRMFWLRQRLALWAKQRKISIILVSHNFDDLLVTCDRVLGVMGPPLTIVAEAAIPLAHPRALRDLASPEITAVKARVYRT
jgi:NitT/TauT family transport system ATP-binding protein